MAVRVKLDKLTEKQANELSELLLIQPKIQDFSKYKKFLPVSQKNVKFWHIEDEYIYIPLMASINYFGGNLNRNLKYPVLNEEKFDFKGTLLERQINPYNNILKQIHEFNTTTVIFPPGFGKTFMGTKLTYDLNFHTCVLVHRESVGMQWVKTFNDYMPWSNPVFVDDKVKYEECRVIVCMDGRIEKIPYEVRKKIGVLIVDEAHCFCSSSRVPALLSFRPKYLILETATPDRPDGMDMMMKLMAGTHMTKEYSKKSYRCIIIETNIDFEELDEKNIFNSLVGMQCENEVRNNLVVDLIIDNMKVGEKENKFIIVSRRVSHCKILKKMIKKKNNEIVIEELHSNIKKIGNSQILLGSISKMGVGFDEANYRTDFDGIPSNILICTTTFKHWGPFEQVRGRIMRCDNPTVVYLVDNDKISKKHMREMKKWIKETNGEIEIIRYENEKILF